MVRAFRVVLAVCTLTATASLLAQTSPQLTVGTDRVTVTGVTAHADVVFFARSVTYRGGVPVLARHAFIERDEDGDGTVTHVEAVPALSVWVTVDVESGAFAYAAPAGFEPKVILLPPGTWRENDGAVNVSRERVDFFSSGRERAHGCWTYSRAVSATRTGEMTRTCAFERHRWRR